MSPNRCHKDRFPLKLGNQEPSFLTDVSLRQGRTVSETAVPTVPKWSSSAGTELRKILDRGAWDGINPADAVELAGRPGLSDGDGDVRRRCLECHWLGEGDKLLVSPADKLTDADCASITTHKPALFELLTLVARREADIAQFTARRDRLVRWGRSITEAEELAERLARRDREHDDRVNCTDCRHYRPGRCENHGRAGLQAPDVGRDLASLLQRCPGFQPPR